MTNQQFIETIAPIIRTVALSRGYKFPSAIIAQACNESGYGRSSLGAKYHNYFGMKCGSSWKGKSVNLQTKEEYVVGQLTDIRANFRVYDSMKNGVIGYFDFISASRYANLKNATSSRDYLEKIKADGYATSSTYVQNVYAVVEKYNLTQYDGEQPTVSVPQQTNKKTVDELAWEVIRGKWGNGLDRKNRLSSQGYNYNEVQARVNYLYKTGQVK